MCSARGLRAQVWVCDKIICSDYKIVIFLLPTYFGLEFEFYKSLAHEELFFISHLVCSAQI
jgi:hypothetical protein